MCGIAAYVGSPPADWPAILDAAARRGCHAYGWAVHDGTRWARFTETETASYAKRIPPPGISAVVHYRLATWGGSAPESIQPFQRDGLVFGHNGNVPRASELPADLLAVSDSFALFSGASGGMAEISGAVFDRLAGSNFAFVLSDGKRIIAARHYHPLFIRRGSEVTVTSIPPDQSTGFYALEEGQIVTL